MDIWVAVYITVAVLFLPCLIAGSIFQIKVHSTFEKYKGVLSVCNITADELSRVLLHKAEIDDVDVVEINGKLTDCYDSKHKVLKLSSSTFSSTSVAALAICAHEVGHAVQDKQKMFLFRLRRALVPVVNFISYMFVPMVLLGSILSFTFYLPVVGLYITWTSVILYGASLIFQLVTLPLEYNASKRALKMLEETKMFSRDELNISKDMLKAAIMTYVSATTISMLYFLRFLSYAMIFASNRKD